MSADIACRGRVTRTPQEKTTTNGSVMALSGLAIDITGYKTEEKQTMFVGLIAFGTPAEKLLRYKKGDSISVHGEFTQSPYTSSDGQERDGYSINVESVLGIRPKPAKKRQKTKIAGKLSHTDILNDPLPEAMR